MRNIIKICGVGIALSLALPSTAAWALTEDQPQQNDATVKQDKQRKVCKTIIDTGSRLGEKRVCKSQSDWNRDREANSQDLENMNRAGGGGPR